MNWERLRQNVLQEVYPEEDELERTRETYNEISSFIEEEFGLETHFAGSSSRGTCMKNDRDIDTFVLFPEDTERKTLEEIGLTVGKETFRNFGGEFKVDYAEHPYTKGSIESYEVEIVPCFDVNPEDIRSAVDRTPHHSRWVQKNLSEEERRDVVILKKFLKSAGLYGSSLKIRGFSGYLCEILISKFGGFKELTETVQDWEQEEVLDPADRYDKIPKDLQKKFSQDSLVVIDPVDSERNVASVLSTENYAKFVLKCWEFSRNPGMNFFQESENDWSKFELKQEVQGRGDFVVVGFERPGEVDDVVYPQMRKLMRLLNKKLDKRDFRVFESGFHVSEEEIRFFFELENDLPVLEELKGPKVFHNSKHLEQFNSKYDKIFVRDERVYAKTERDFTSAKAFLRDFLNDNVTSLKKKGIPGNIADCLVEHGFESPLEGNEKWFNYLAKKLNL